MRATKAGRGRGHGVNQAGPTVSGTTPTAPAGIHTDVACCLTQDRRCRRMAE